MNGEIIAGSRINGTSLRLDDAAQTHQRIMLSARMAAESLCDMCAGLKHMRDERLYEELGYEDFDTYCAEMVGIKARQAYTYIAAYERMGAAVLQSTARLGITKLELLSRLPEAARNELIESGEADEATVKKLAELVAERDRAAETISLLEAQLAEAESERERAVNEAEEKAYADATRDAEAARVELIREKEAAEKRAAEHIGAEKEAAEAAMKLNAEMEKSKKLAAAKKAAEDALREAKEKLAELEAAKAEENEESDETEDPEQVSIELIEEAERAARAAAAAEYEAKIAELEKRLRASDAESATMKGLLDALRANFERAREYAAAQKDEGTRARLTTALRRLMAVLSGTIEEAGS
jgi:chromosome segregation ATPase